ncbi:hypothetical protein P4H94_33340, partial [Paenibacillus macerans]|uniref:hypothetical protein n=1 Tax=Paenibacillus macerans TaxID=44252 RepID=UPI002DC0140D
GVNATPVLSQPLNLVYPAFCRLSGAHNLWNDAGLAWRGCAVLISNAAFAFAPIFVPIPS